MSAGQVRGPILEVRGLRPAKYGGLGKREPAALLGSPAWQLGLLFSLPLQDPGSLSATLLLMPQAGCNKPCWPGSTSGYKIWLSQHLGEWGNCHPGARGLGQDQWADKGMVGGPEHQGASQSVAAGRSGAGEDLA